MSPSPASPLTLGLIFVVVGMATAVVQAVLVERLVPRYGEKRMALVGLLGYVRGERPLLLICNMLLKTPTASKRWRR